CHLLFTGETAEKRLRFYHSDENLFLKEMLTSLPTRVAASIMVINSMCSTSIVRVPGDR
ncbi:hypothetical protein OS493_035977, partial [Desmophyllum pertusum]